MMQKKIILIKVCKKLIKKYKDFKRLNNNINKNYVKD